MKKEIMKTIIEKNKKNDKKKTKFIHNDGNKKMKRRKRKTPK